METIVKVIGEEATTRFKPGDLVKSVRYDAVLLVIRVETDGDVFDGFVLNKGKYSERGEKTFHMDFSSKDFVQFKGTVTLESK